MLIEPLAFHKFHGVKDAAIGQRADIVHRNDSRMLQPRQHARLAQQAICQFALRARHFEHLERHAALQLLVLRRINNAHAPARHLPEQPVARAAQVRNLRAFAQTGECLIGKMPHG